MGCTDARLCFVCSEANRFPVGTIMEKNVAFRGGQLFGHSYWRFLLSKIKDGTIDLRSEKERTAAKTHEDAVLFDNSLFPRSLFLSSQWVTHQVPFSEIADAYRVFDSRELGV